MDKEFECLEDLKQLYILSGIKADKDGLEDDSRNGFRYDHCCFFIDLKEDHELKIRLFTNKIFLIDYFLPLYFGPYCEYVDPDYLYVEKIIDNFSKIDFDEQFACDLLKYYKFHSFIYNNYAYYVDTHSVLASVQYSGATLEHLNDGFKCDKDIVMAAVKENGMALRFANLDAMKHDVLRQAIYKQEHKEKFKSLEG